jgi:predicted DNA binding CopG/RHH family protein
MSTSKRVKLDESEEALERSFQQEAWATNTDPKAREQAMNAARLSKSERTNIRLSEGDLMGIKQKALEKGLGYQTLIASLVHQYVSGRLLEVDSQKLNQMVSGAVHALFQKTAHTPKRASKSKSTVKRRA